MLFKEYKETHVHLKSMLRQPHEILYRTRTSFVMYFEEAGVHVVESSNQNLSRFIEIVKSFNPVRILTTNKAIYDCLYLGYAHLDSCYEYGPFPFIESSICLEDLRESDLPKVFDTYWDSDEYIRQLFERNRLKALYDGDSLVGYVAKHIDNSMGAVWVNPKYRRQGFGYEILKAVATVFDDDLLFSHVDEYNSKSIALHDKAPVQLCPYKVYWMYNEGFMFK